MNLDKKKYKAKEIADIFNGFKADYENKLAEQKERILSLSTENRRLQAEVEEYKGKDEVISSTLKTVTASAKLKEKELNDKYYLETERLKAFSLRWYGYFEYIKEKYPFYKATNEAQDLYNELNRILSANLSPKDTVSALQGKFDEGGYDKGANLGEKTLKKAKFDPKSKVEDYLATTGDNGFSMQEVLNPGELKLEDLCKELGLTDEK